MIDRKPLTPEVDPMNDAKSDKQIKKEKIVKNIKKGAKAYQENKTSDVEESDTKTPIVNNLNMRKPLYGKSYEDSIQYLRNASKRSVL